MDTPATTNIALTPAQRAIQLRDDLRLIDQTILALMLGVQESTVERWRAEETGPTYVRLGRAIFYTAHDIYDWILSNTVKLHPDQHDIAGKRMGFPGASMFPFGIQAAPGAEQATPAEPTQIDLEDAIAAATPVPASENPWAGKATVITDQEADVTNHDPLGR